MKALHKKEKEQLKKLFHQEQIDRFEDRYNILEAFLQKEHHITTGELVHVLNENGYDYSREFVRDTLKLMCSYGFAQRNRFDNGQLRYEHRHLGQHHDHMICLDCRAVVELTNEEIERLQEQVAKRNGFALDDHSLTLFVRCKEWKSKGECERRDEHEKTSAGR